MAAAKNNRYSFQALAYCKTEQHRKDAFEAYCEHVAAGHLKESFTWRAKDGIGRATYNTIKRLLEKYEEELPLYLLDEANSKNLFKWQALAYELASGAKKGEGFVWINNMHNRFRHLGWNISQPKDDDAAAIADQQAKQDKVADLATEINDKTKS